MLQAVIFDMDGTLLNSVDQHATAWQRAFEYFGLHFPFEEIRYQIGKGGDKLLAVFLDPVQQEDLGKKLEEYRADLFKKELLKSCKPFPCVKELLNSLRKRQLKIALGSSGKKDDIETYMRMLDITDMVDEVVGSDDVERSKPDPEVVAAARHKLGDLPPDACCFIGDSPHDAEAAKRDGTKMIGVLCGGFHEEDLRAAGANAIYRDPEDLLKRWVPE